MNTPSLNRVLFVDDDETILRMYSHYFTAEGWKVGSASNGVNAKQLLEQQEFDAVVTDFQMPQMDGLELAGFIVAHDPNLAVLLCSGLGCAGRGEFDFKAILEQKGLRRCAVLPKPVRPRCVQQSLERLWR